MKTGGSETYGGPVDIVVAVEREESPRWGKLIVCVLETAIHAIAINAMLPPGLFIVGLLAGAACGGIIRLHDRRRACLRPDVDHGIRQRPAGYVAAFEFQTFQPTAMFVRDRTRFAGHDKVQAN